MAELDWSGLSGKYFISSKQGYNVSISFNQKEKKYSSWPPKPGRDEVHRALGIRKTLAAAQRLCQTHYDNQRRQ